MFLKERYVMEEIVKKLNVFLCNLEVFNVKLQNYHWNVNGKGFFITHEKLEEYYNDLRKEIDEIAEHILALGYQPLGTIQDFLNNSEIKEAKNEKIKSIPIIRNIIQDFYILKQQAMQIKEEAEKQADYATSSLIDNYLAKYTKKIWMLNETIK
jgi:starvation-inducible DNA-binding protein